MNAVNKSSSNTLTDATLLAAFHVGNGELEEEEISFVCTCHCNLSDLSLITIFFVDYRIVLPRVCSCVS